jgi:3-deoxy-D-manno-octulosonic-acid transferase
MLLRLEDGSLHIFLRLLPFLLPLFLDFEKAILQTSFSIARFSEFGIQSVYEVGNQFRQTRRG